MLYIVDSNKYKSLNIRCATGHAGGLLLHKGRVFVCSPKLISPFKMGKLGAHLLPCTSFPPPLPFCGFSPNNIVEKFLRTGNILSKGYPALWHLKCCTFLPICHCSGQPPACESLCNALGWPGRASPCTSPQDSSLTALDKPAPSDFFISPFCVPNPSHLHGPRRRSKLRWLSGAHPPQGLLIRCFKVCPQPSS